MKYFSMVSVWLYAMGQNQQKTINKPHRAQLLYHCLPIQGKTTMTTSIYIVQSQKNGTVRERYHLVGVYSNKQLADEAGKEHCDYLNEFYEEQQNYSVTILPLDGVIDERNQ